MFGAGRDCVGERLARFVLGVLEDPRTRRPMLGLVRAAASEPEAARMARELLTGQVLAGIVDALGVDDAELRTSLAASQIVGLLMARHVVGIEPLASMPAERVAAAIAPNLQRYLTGALDPPATPDVEIAWTAAAPPRHETLLGERVRLEPVDADRHADDLFAASHGAQADPELWRFLPYGPFAERRRATRPACGHGALDRPALPDRGRDGHRPGGRRRQLPQHRPGARLDRDRAHLVRRRLSSGRRPPPRRSTCSAATPSTTSATGGWSGSATPSTRARARRGRASGSPSRASSAST